VNAPFTRVCFDFVLQPALDADEARPQARMDRATA
jgi:catechol 1,2-dioxygenase